MATNFTLSDFVVRFNGAINRRFISVEVPKTNLTLELTSLLYKNGIINSFFVNEKIRIYLKYYNNSNKYFNLFLVSTPGRRVYWSLSKLSQSFNRNNFSSFYIISTSQGLLTSYDCLLHRHISGEVLLKVKI